MKPIDLSIPTVISDEAIARFDILYFGSTPFWAENDNYKAAALRILSELIKYELMEDDGQLSEMLNRGFTLLGNLRKSKSAIARENGFEILLGLYAHNALPPELMQPIFHEQALPPSVIVQYMTRHHERILVARFLHDFLQTCDESIMQYALNWIKPLAQQNIVLTDSAYSPTFQQYIANEVIPLYKHPIFPKVTKEFENCLPGATAKASLDETSTPSGYSSRKEREDAWSTLTRESALNIDDLAFLIKDWGEDFPLKHLEKQLQSSSATFRAALKSGNYGVLVFLNRTSHRLIETLNYSIRDWERIADDIFHLYKDWRWHGATCDLSLLWQLIIKQHWTPEWRNEHSVIAAAPDSENRASDWGLLKDIPSVLMSAWADRILSLNEQAKWCLLNNFTINYLMDIIMAPWCSSLSDLQDFSLPFLKECFDTLNKRKDAWAKDYTPLLIQLWAYGFIEAPSIESLKREQCRESLFRSLSRFTMSAPADTPENRSFATWISNESIQFNEAWPSYWNRLTILASQTTEPKIDTSAKIWVGNAGFRDAWCLQVVDAFSTSSNHGIAKEFESYLYATRSQNIHRLKRNVLSEQQVESLKALASRGGVFAWSMNAIQGCLSSSELSDQHWEKIKAELEADFMPQLVGESVVWLMRKTDVPLSLDSPWIGMKVFSQSFNDRPTVWARQIFTILQRNDLVEREAVRLTFALGHLREPLGGEVPMMIAALKDRFPNAASILITQRKLFNGENLNRGHYKDAAKRVNAARLEVMKIQKGF